MPKCTESTQRHQVWISEEPQPGGTSLRITTGMPIASEDLSSVLGILHVIDPVGHPQMRVTCSVEDDALVLTVVNTADEKHATRWELVVRLLDDAPKKSSPTPEPER